MAPERDKIMFMPHCWHLRFCALVASLGLACGSLASHAQDDDSHRGRKYKTPPLSARVEVTVLRDLSGKPIEDAHVIFHPVEGDKDKGSLELKTNEDGKIVIDVIPIGDTVRLQIIAKGFQTYGNDFKIDKPEVSMEIRMKRPGAQYSVYKNSAQTRAQATAPAQAPEVKSLLTLPTPLRPPQAANPPAQQPARRPTAASTQVSCVVLRARASVQEYPRSRPAHAMNWSRYGH